jgi:hypothetical protein
LIIPRQLQGIIPEDLRLVGEGAGLPNTPGEDAEQEAKHRTKESAQEARPWVDRLARFGYATKGLVYVVVGALALGVATGVGGRTTDLPGALQEIGAQPFGRVMLGFVAVGLAAYALWRLFQAVADPEGEGRDARGAAARTGHVAAWLGYSGLAFTAGQLVVTSSGGESPKDWTAAVLSLPFGWVLVLGIGTGVAVYGLHQLYQAYQAQFEEHIEGGQMSNGVGSLIKQGGRFGLAARGVVIGIAGGFLIVAALRFDPNEATGLGGTLQTLLQEPFGPWLLGAAALGFVAYGLLMLAVARYGRIVSGRAF